MPVVDLHTHFFPENWPDLTQRCGTPDWPWMRRDGPDRATVMVGAGSSGRSRRRAGIRPCALPTWIARVSTCRSSPPRRSSSPTTALPSTPSSAPASSTTRCSSCAPRPGRLIPIAQVPLQDTDLACRELERMLAAGMRGVQIGNHVGDRDLDDHGIVEFLAHCASLGAPVFVHPWDMFGGCRLDEWMLRWTVAMPSETHLSLNRMILGGVRPAAARSASASPTAAGRSRSCSGGWTTPGTAARRRGHSTARQLYLDRFEVDSAVPTGVPCATWWT